MKKAFVFAGLAAATLSFVGCNKEADFARNSRKVEIVLSDIDTRTVNNGMETEWNAGDELSVFNAPAGTSTWSSNIKFTVQDASANRATGEVELTADAYDWYAFYPYTSKIPNPTTLNPEGSTYERSGYSTVGGQFQTQKMDDNKEHLAGVKVPVFGNVKNVPAGETPVIEMKNAASVVRFKVVNAQEEEIKVLSVKFTAPEDIVGTYYIDFSGTEPSFVGSGDNYVFDNVMVTNAAPSGIAPDSNADYYAVIKPFTAAAGAKLKVEVEAETVDGSKKGTATKEITLSAATEFKAGHIKLLNIPFDAAMTGVTAMAIPYEQAFAEGTGDFTIDNAIGSGIWTPGSNSGNHFMKGTSYLGGTNTEGESWLISPEIDATTVENGVKLSFKQCVNKFFGDVTKEATLWAREKGGEWEQFTITYPTPNGTWSAFEEQVVDLSAFKGKTFQFAFKYVGHSTGAGTWEVMDIHVTDAVVTAAFNAELPGADESLSLTVPATTTSVTINVTGNVAWTASASDGANAAPATGEGAGTVTVSFPANTDSTPKEYSVTVSTEDAAIIAAGGDEFVFNITQEAASGELTATIDFSEQEYTNGEEVVTATADGVTFTFDKGTNNTTPKYYTTGTAVRMYGSNTLTVTAGGKTITSIVFTFGSGDGTNPITASVPTYDEPTWTGEAASVTFTIGGTSGQRRIKAITVKYSDSGAPATATLVSIAVAGQKTEFNVGDEFTHDTAKVTATYSDDTTKDVTASATFSSPDMTTAGTKEVTVTYQEGGITKEAKYDITVSAVDPDANTVSMTMTDYVTEHGCEISSGNDNIHIYKTLQLNPSVRMSTTGEPNCGAFYGASTQEWRLYQNKDGNVIITVANGCELKSVKLTYGTSNNGTLVDGAGNAVASNAVQTVSGSSVTYTVGNKTDATNGQVKITAVEVKYTGNGTTFPDNPDPQPTEIETKITMPNNANVYVGETVALNATSNVEGATITYESEDPAIATVNASGVVTGVAEGSVKVWARIAGVAGSYTSAEHYCTVTVATKPVQTDGTEVFIFSELGYANQADVTTVKGNNVTLVFDKGEGTNAPKYYTNGTNVRMYKNNTLAISSEKTITKIEFFCTDGYGIHDEATFSTGTCSNDVWEGSAKSVELVNATSGTTQIRFTSIKVTYE